MQGTVVDATFIDSEYRNTAKQTGGFEGKLLFKMNTDTGCMKMDTINYFDHKGRVLMDLGSKLNRKIVIIMAISNDSTECEDIICGDERKLFGDKAYTREILKQINRDKCCYYSIIKMDKRNDPLNSKKKTLRLSSKCDCKCNIRL